MKKPLESESPDAGIERDDATSRVTNVTVDKQAFDALLGKVIASPPIPKSAIAGKLPNSRRPAK